MSSVTRFIRQIPQATTYYNAATVVGAPTTYVYEFVPSGSNYVGNYPKPYPDASGGTMQTASPALVASINQVANAAGGAVNLVLRDMGKTIFAPIASGSTTWAYFRQVQLLDPVSGINSASQGFIGGTNGTTFGVLGDQSTPDAYTNFLTFYIPVNIGGIGLPAASSSNAFALAGGQM